MRVWQSGEDGTPFGPQELRGEVEHPLTGRRVPFTSTEALLAVLRGDDRAGARPDPA